MYRLALFATVFLPGWALAGTQEVIDAVEKRYAAVESIRGDFTQTTTSELYGSSTVTGSVVLQKPAQMRWDFADGKQYLSDGSRMWITTPAEKQVLEMSDVAASAGQADTLLQSLDKVSELFDVELLEETDTVKRVKLTPKGGSDMLKEVVLALDGDYVVQSVGIVDAFGSKTELAFKDVKLAGKVDPSTFTFSLPEGYEVLKN
jgi:chaperone LolA